MLQRPRRLKFLTSFNLSKERDIKLNTHNKPQLILVRPLNLKWYHFETLRIKIARILAKQRRGGKKALFKQQAVKPLYKVKRKRTLMAKPKKQHIKFYGFPSIPMHYKTQGSRMGKGKGGTLKWYYKAKTGTPIIQFNISNTFTLFQISRKLTQLIPCKIKIYSELLTSKTLFTQIKLNNSKPTN